MTDRKKADEPRPDEPQLHGESEPPPPGHDEFTGMFTEPQPFDTPPDEPVRVVGEVPWELREDD